MTDTGMDMDTGTGMGTGTDMGMGTGPGTTYCTNIVRLRVLVYEFYTVS